MLKRLEIAWLLVTVATSLANAQRGDKQRPQAILVGPNVLVSRDGSFAHVECMVAVNPNSSRNLIATTLADPDSAETMTPRTYMSGDGGNTWTPTNFYGMYSRGGDPQVAFGPNGTAYFVYMDQGTDEQSGQTREQLQVYRAEDGGRTWLPSATLGLLDHPQIGVDTGSRLFRGRVYIWGLHTASDEFALYLSQSGDDGRTFTNPVAVVHRKGGMNTSPPVVLSDGTLVLPYFEFNYDENTQVLDPIRKVKLVSSSDGGLTFSSPSQIGVQVMPTLDYYKDRLKDRLLLRSKDTKAPRLGAYFDEPRPPQFAADSQSSRFRDRIYAVWADTRKGNSRILFTFSPDQGRSWSEPRLIDANIPMDAYQYMPEIAVNKQGVVGVQWLDTRGSLNQQYDVYFAASLDGGQSFSASRRISSKSSSPATNINLTPHLGAYRTTTTGTTLLFSTVYFRDASGGDYMGLAADTEGIFHPLWADSRNGTFQVFTAQVQVGQSCGMGDESAAHPTNDAIGKQLSLILDPVEFDSQTGRLTLPVRLRNFSASVRYGPLALEVKSLTLRSPALRATGFTAPRIVNSANGKTGSGAVFDYSRAFGDCDALAPGHTSEAVPWVLEIDNVGQGVFDIETRELWPVR